jgi:hypothetical protein
LPAGSEFVDQLVWLAWMNFVCTENEAFVGSYEPLPMNADIISKYEMEKTKLLMVSDLAFELTKDIDPVKLVKNF